jgi:hypothetical protein
MSLEQTLEVVKPERFTGTAVVAAPHFTWCALIGLFRSRRWPPLRR